LNLDNEVARRFEEIWENMHYDVDAGDLSRTLYQTNKSLDYIEEILIQFDEVMKA
jgi:hypothetical protein